MKPSRRERFVRTCQQLAGARIERVEYPGGKSRDSCRLILEDGRAVYGTQRSSVKAATLEARVLRRLGEQGAPVPKVLAFNGLVLIQEDLGDLRLSQALEPALPGEARRLLTIGLDALVDIYRAAEAAGLDGDVPIIGRDENWLRGLLNQPRVISDQLGLTPPDLDHDEILELLRPRQPRLVKWDARLGNAILQGEAAAWIDWEHCGARNRLDDLTWVLGDEMMPDLADVEEELLAAYLPAFADGLGADEARARFALFGCFHSCVRLDLILEKKNGGPWWDWQYCLDADKAGVTVAAAQRLCGRGARWASWNPLVVTLGPWFRRVAEKMAALGPHGSTRFG